MIRKVKVLGLAVVAVLAVTAVAASSASADFKAEADHVIVTGTNNGSHTFVTDPGTIHCNKATFSGTIHDTDDTTTDRVTINTIAYSECTLTTIFGNITVTVNMNGCDYLFTTSGVVHLSCPEGKSVSVSGPGCTVTVPGGQELSNNTYTNLGTGATREVQVHSAVNNIKYSYTGFTCGSGSNTADGVYTGTTTITGENTKGEHVGIWSLH